MGLVMSLVLAERGNIAGRRAGVSIV